MREEERLVNHVLKNIFHTQNRLNVTVVSWILLSYHFEERILEVEDVLDIPLYDEVSDCDWVVLIHRFVFLVKVL